MKNKKHADARSKDSVTERNLILEMLVERDNIDEVKYSEHFSVTSGHLDPERVFLAATGEVQLTKQERGHLDSCNDCAEHIALWQGGVTLSGSDSLDYRESYPIYSSRLAASMDEQVVLREWTICRSPSESRVSSANATVLRIESDASVIGDEDVMIRLDWQDERGRLLGNSLGVLDRSLPIVADDGVRTRVRIGEISVPDSIVSVPGSVLANIKVVACLDDIGVSAIECLEQSLTQSLSLGLTKCNAWANVLESIFERSPKVPNEVESMVMLLLSEYRTQLENTEGLKRFNSMPLRGREKQADLCSSGIHQVGFFNSFAASVSVFTFFAHCIR